MLCFINKSFVYFCSAFFKWCTIFKYYLGSCSIRCSTNIDNNNNKKVIGKMKDEYGGVIIDQFIGFKSKMYSIKKVNGSESSTTKGVNVATEFNEFKDVLFNKKIIRHKMKRIKAKKHKIGTYEIDKISLSCFDDKRYVLDDGVNTLAYFRKDCNKKCDKNKNNHNHNNDQ